MNSATSKPKSKHIAIIGILVLAIVAASYVWWQQYIYWLNTSYVEYSLCFSLASHFGIASVIYILFSIGRKNRLPFMHSLTLMIVCFVVIAALEVLVRATGLVQNYGETRDGRYISQYDNTLRSAYYTYDKNAELIMESGSEFRFTRRTNEIGLLFQANVEKREGVKRILALGDSFTAGDGAHEDSTWTTFMYRKLLDKKMDAASLQIINAGVQGSDPVYQYKLLEDKLLNYNPDLVILAVNNTDIGEIGTRGGVERFVDDTLCIPKRGPWWESIYASSHITRLILQVIFDINYSLMTKADFDENQQNCALELKKVIKDFENIASENGFKFLVCFIPIKGDIKEGGFHSLFGLEKQLTKSNARDVEYLNLFPAYVHGGMSAENVDIYYWPKDGHHKAEGYRIFGEAVAGHIVQKELLTFN